MADDFSVLVLGGTGMLGSMVTSYLTEQSVPVIATHSSRSAPLISKKDVPHLEWRLFDADNPNWSAIFSNHPISFPSIRFVINCIGRTKPLIDENNAESVSQAIMINSSFPYSLAEAAFLAGVDKVIQIATDCVYDGSCGFNTEYDPFSAKDVYGVTKYLGETIYSTVQHLRCSIVGPEATIKPKYLLHWLIDKARGEGVNGYIDHKWNGVTTYHFAKLCLAIMRTEDLELPRLLHVTPGDTCSKYQLLKFLAAAYDREDLRISPVPAPKAVDMRLSTSFPEANDSLWTAAGYASAPSIFRMIRELALAPYIFTTSEG